MENNFSHFAYKFLPSPSVLRACCAAMLVGISASAWSAPEAAPRIPVGKSAAPKAGVININTADVDTLAELDGVGPGKAAAIIDYRKQHGPFKTVDQLADVKGIGETLLAKNRDRISVR